jgi:hypothetical protein
VIENEDESLLNVEHASNGQDELESGEVVGQIETSNKADQLMHTLSEIARLKEPEGSDVSRDLQELMARGDSELSKDLVVCGKCHADFRLQDMSLFIEHKLNRCVTPATTGDSCEPYCCVNCAKHFKSAHLLLEHYEVAHGGQRSGSVGRKPGKKQLQLQQLQHQLVLQQDNNNNNNSDINQMTNGSLNSSFAGGAFNNKKVKTKHITDQITTAGNNFNFNAQMQQQQGKFKNIKTIQAGQNLTGKFNVLGTGKSGQFKNHQFIAAQLSNLQQQQQASAPLIKINSSLSNRLRIEEIKQQQQEHVAKKLLLQQQQQQQQQNGGHELEKQQLKAADTETSAAVKSELSDPESGLHVSTKLGNVNTVDPLKVSPTNNLIAIKLPDQTVKLLNGNPNSVGGSSSSSSSNSSSSASSTTNSSTTNATNGITGNSNNAFATLAAAIASSTSTSNMYSQLSSIFQQQQQQQQQAAAQSAAQQANFIQSALASATASPHHTNYYASLLNTPGRHLTHSLLFIPNLNEITKPYSSNIKHKQNFETFVSKSLIISRFEKERVIKVSHF